MDGKCRTKPVIFTLRLRFTFTFSGTLFFDFFKLIEVRLGNVLGNQLCVFVRIDKVDIGSTITDFDVLLPANTIETEDSIMDSLITEIYQNATGTLSTYFPIPPGPVNETILGINGKFEFI